MAAILCQPTIFAVVNTTVPKILNYIIMNYSTSENELNYYTCYYYDIILYLQLEPMRNAAKEAIMPPVCKTIPGFCVNN